MSGDDDEGVTVTPPERYAIGLSFGNSNSSIAHTSSVCTGDGEFGDFFYSTNEVTGRKS